MENRIHNFSAGPAALPLPVLEEAQRTLVVLPGAGASVMEISHRSKNFEAVLQAAKSNIANLLNLPDNYQVLFVQGGATLQFSMVAMNFLRGSGKSADYIVTGAWGSKAYKEAQKEGSVRFAWNGKGEGYKRTPITGELQLDANAAYCHFTSNETIEGVQFSLEPETGETPLICDASSDFLSRPIAIHRYGLLYAGAQKNVGPSGLAVVIVRKDLLERIPANLPSLLDYKLLAENDSLYNTPPTFGIYMVMLVTKWLIEEIGGLDKMDAINRRKAAMLYDAIDSSEGFYKPHAQTESRSMMNVTWRFATEELEAAFVKEAKAAEMEGLKGHRSVGGIRASIYNAVPVASVEALSDFMKDFRKRKA